MILKKLNLIIQKYCSIKCACGNVIIELYPEISPNGVKRFITLVKSKAYDDIAFHRVIKDTLCTGWRFRIWKKRKYRLWKNWNR